MTFIDGLEIESFRIRKCFRERRTCNIGMLEIRKVSRWASLVPGQRLPRRKEVAVTRHDCKICK